MGSGGANDGSPDTSVGPDAADANRRECSGANECPQPTGECAYATCVDGGCGKAFHPAGTACSFGGGNICDGTGSCVECVQPSDCGTPSNSPCVIATCSVDHHCGTANAPPTTNCGDAPFCYNQIAHAQDKCNGSGSCVPGAEQDCSPYVCRATICTTTCDNDLGCWTSFECDLDLATCIPDTIPKCTNYCNTIQSACAGANQQYPSNAECLHSCAGLPRDAATSGNTMGCRNTHAGLAAAGDPVMHCPHAGPAGDGVCGANCESFCSLAATTCVGGNQQFNDPSDCNAKCGAFGNVGDHYTTASVTGDTFACRMYHLTLATVDPGTHCPHIAPVSSACHN